jgi:hypothetical protein
MEFNFAVRNGGQQSDTKGSEMIMSSNSLVAVKYGIDVLARLLILVAGTRAGELMDRLTD